MREKGRERDCNVAAIECQGILCIFPRHASLNTRLLSIIQRWHYLLRLKWSLQLKNVTRAKAERPWMNTLHTASIILANDENVPDQN